MGTHMVNPPDNPNVCYLCKFEGLFSVNVKLHVHRELFIFLFTNSSVNCMCFDRIVWQAWNSKHLESYQQCVYLDKDILFFTFVSWTFVLFSIFPHPHTIFINKSTSSTRAINVIPLHRLRIPPAAPTKLDNFIAGESIISMTLGSYFIIRCRKFLVMRSVSLIMEIASASSPKPICLPTSLK